MAKSPAPTPDPALEDLGSPEALSQFVGLELKQHRLNQHLTIQDVSELSGISRGMLSRIENGQATPSLDTLFRLSNTLGVSMSNLFKDFDAPEGDAKYVPKGEGMDVARRGTKKGHVYELLSYDQGPKKLFEPLLITLDDQSEIFPRFQHAGTEFIYMLKGKMDYRHGKQVYRLKPGDALTFDGNVPHGPEELLSVPIKFLTIIHYGTLDL
ncbi:MAG: helix-turn-helix domain-containing protein [Gammaproteobacteria bacterium]